MKLLIEIPLRAIQLGKACGLKSGSNSLPGDSKPPRNHLLGRAADIAPDKHFPHDLGLFRRPVPGFVIYHKDQSPMQKVGFGAAKVKALLRVHRVQQSARVNEGATSGVCQIILHIRGLPEPQSDAAVG